MTFTFEGADKDISVLKRADKKLKDAIGKALKPSESGFLIRNVVYFDVDVSLEDVASPSSNEERLNCDIQTAKNVLNDLVQIGERVCWNALSTLKVWKIVSTIILGICFLLRGILK